MTMPLPNLDRLCGAGLLHAEPPAADEYAGLLRSGLARLRDAGNASLALESRFDLAYNASHALCLAALRWHGFRPANKRFIVFQVLPDTLGLGPEVWRVLAKGHDQRNLGEYEGHLDIDERFVTDLVAACAQVAAKIDTLPPPKP
ncbi:MAG: hypothetical protein ING39_08505 [Burkholderiales bacterium]|nr:hypothetical protein [Burkholderiales bacterium]